ncbi:MAG: hypothetical protein ACI90V_011406, partial [Bacillariaceae sp.]
ARKVTKRNTVMSSSTDEKEYILEVLHKQVLLIYIYIYIDIYYVTVTSEIHETRKAVFFEEKISAAFGRGEGFVS